MNKEEAVDLFRTKFSIRVFKYGLILRLEIPVTEFFTICRQFTKIKIAQNRNHKFAFILTIGSKVLWLR